ncbi:hypothetical protein ABLO27_19315 [Roseibium sp. SCPC15]|jgi:hypothetical protein|uniref:hypothetical protein n=1 Tax=Roseibium sp. SCP15 TaxID=3141376 RepID=UPI003335E7D3
MKTASILSAAVFSVLVMQGSAANAGQNCWGLEGQALKDCIGKMVDEIAQTGHETEQPNQQQSQTLKKTAASRQKSR